jgi:(p)ppGpp synthase/HD superfamily hydrolase
MTALTLPKRALAYAARAHEGQVRELGGGRTEPYVEHCRRVMASAALLCDDEGVQAAAALHDVIEDTIVTRHQIEAMFGPYVAGMVEALSDKFGPQPGYNRKQRKAMEAIRLGGLKWECRLIKLCDVLDNAASIEAKGGAFAEVWRVEKAELVWMLLGGDR